MNDEWEKVAEYYNLNQDTREDVVIAKINCVDDSELCISQAIFSYPTIKLFRKGSIQSVSDYNG